MRKTSYAIAFLLVGALLAVNISSIIRTDWLLVRGEGHLGSHNLARFGLAQRCARDLLEIPAPDDGVPEIVYSDWECRPFPMSIRDHCEQGNRRFCVSWATASYIYEIGLGFNVLALLAIIFGVSTHSRRRRIWKAVAGLVGLAALFPMIAFAIISELYRTSKFWEFARARPGAGWYISIVYWVAGIVVTGLVVTNGVAAAKGHAWAAGKRAYRPILSRANSRASRHSHSRRSAGRTHSHHSTVAAAAQVEPATSA
ncbi:hypothetical protein PENSPDRAFT_691306 [Peniophora sp. CONT]|nr:hypothetical protein PENSPDRAFT_691306 [Peniophora sp. CONT]